MQIRNMVFGLTVVSLLAGCSFISEREQADYKAGAIKKRPLEVPPELTTPETEQRYTIPGTDEKAASFSEYSKGKTEQPCVNPVAATPAATPNAADIPAAKLKEGNGTKSIMLYEPFDRSWRRVGLALDRAQFVTTDKDRSKGIYFVTSPAPEKDSKKKQPGYQVAVGGSNDNVEVTLVDQSGKSDAETTRLIELLYQNLGEKAPAADEHPRGGPSGGMPGGRGGNDAVRPPR